MHCKAEFHKSRTADYHGWIALVLRAGSKPVPIVAKDLLAGRRMAGKRESNSKGRLTTCLSATINLKVA
jgi:hypothetical protein